MRFHTKEDSRAMLGMDRGFCKGGYYAPTTVLIRGPCQLGFTKNVDRSVSCSGNPWFEGSSIGVPICPYR